jgi:hypothetical protein
MHAITNGWIDELKGSIQSNQSIVVDRIDQIGGSRSAPEIALRMRLQLVTSASRNRFFPEVYRWQCGQFGK